MVYMMQPQKCSPKSDGPVERLRRKRRRRRQNDENVRPALQDEGKRREEEEL